MVVAAKTLMDAGIESVARHDHALSAYAFEQLHSVPGVTVGGNR
jgi:selenocysteine lyase/cysteine desulfurase